MTTAPEPDTTAVEPTPSRSSRVKARVRAVSGNPAVQRAGAVVLMVGVTVAVAALQRGRTGGATAGAPSRAVTTPTPVRVPLPPPTGYRVTWKTFVPSDDGFPPKSYSMRDHTKVFTDIDQGWDWYQWARKGDRVHATWEHIRD